MNQQEIDEIKYRRRGMKIGFTGTRQGLTDLQRVNLRTVLIKIHEQFGVDEFHHGDCVGADAEAHKIACELDGAGRIIHIHPPDNPTHRAYCENVCVKKVYEVYGECSYIARNIDIVRSTDILIVSSKTVHEEVRSGTWATYRSAIRNGKTVVKLWPETVDGKGIEVEGSSPLVRFSWDSFDAWLYRKD